MQLFDFKRKKLNKLVMIAKNITVVPEHRNTGKINKRKSHADDPVMTNHTEYFTILEELGEPAANSIVRDAVGEATDHNGNDIKIYLPLSLGKRSLYRQDLCQNRQAC